MVTPEDTELSRRVVIKFADDLGDRGDACRAEIDGALSGEFPGVGPLEVYTSRGDVPRSYSIDVPPSLDATAVVRRLRSWSEIELAYVEGGPTAPPGTVNASDDPLAAKQGYLAAAPEGIGAYAAWEVEGGDGEGVTIADLEQGWNLQHADLADAHIELVSGVNIKHAEHGTAVLGVIAAADNHIGGVGIVPHATVKAISVYERPDKFSVARALQKALDVLKEGDVLLLEAQTLDEGDEQRSVPVETEWAICDTIRWLVEKGIVVVEAAGNGRMSLDKYENANGHVLDPDAPEFIDSGAILVAAATSTHPHVRIDESNYGKRIDCYAWGQNITTTTASDATSKGSTEFTDDFKNTSGAAAIVAAAAVAVQGMAKRALGRPLSPGELRDILKDPENGTPPDPSKGPIGVMPDLAKIIAVIRHMAVQSPGGEPSSVAEAV